MNARLFSFLLVSLGLTLASCPARAENNPLTWDVCVKEALAQNPDLKKSAAQLRSATYDKKGAVSSFLPSLSASASANKSGDAGSLSGIFKEDDASSSYRMGLSASVNLFNGFKDKASLDQASLSQKTAEVQYRQARAQLSYDLKVAFNNLLTAQEQVRLASDIAARQKENVRLVALRYQSGRENKGSLLNSQATSAQADLEVTQAQRSLRLAQRKLDRVLGRSELDQPVVQGVFDVTAPEASPDFALLAKTVPSFLFSSLQYQSSKSRVTSAKGAFLPSLNANASMSRSGSDWVPDQNSWGAGLALSLPLFEGGQRAFNLKSAQADRDAAKESLVAAEQDAALALESAYWDFRNASESTLVQKKYLEAAQTQEEVATAQYANGLLTYQNWDLVESNLITRQKSHLQSLKAAKNAEASWALALGKDELP
jgi:outer membrane protein